MISITSLRVVSLDIDNRVLLWEAVESGGDSYFDYQLQVERSESSEGPFYPASPWFQGHYRYVDTDVPVGNKWRQLHYRLRYKNLRTQEEDFTSSATQEPMPDLVAMEMRRHLHMLYKRHSGRRAWLFPARTFGTRCPHCWDQALGQRTRSHCLSCFDTSFLEGYLRPIEIFIDINPSGNTNQPTTQAGALQPNSTTARMGHYPAVKPDDLLIEGENVRWVVVSVTNTEYNRAPIQQNLELRQVNPTDVEMRVKLDLGQALEDIWLSPKESYTEPRDVDGEIAWAMRAMFRIGDRL